MASDRVNEVYYGNLHSLRVQQDLQNRIHWMCSQAQGTNVLDIGCSQGILSMLLAREGFQVTGIDVDHDALQFAEKEKDRESAETGARLDFRNVSAFDCDFADGQFDTVYLGEIIEHLANPGKIIALAARWTAPGGRLIITTPFGVLEDPEHVRFFYLSDFIDLVTPSATPEALCVIGKRICLSSRVHPPEDDASTAVELDLLAESEKAFLECERTYLAELHQIHERVSTLGAERGELRKELAAAREESAAMRADGEGAAKQLELLSKRLDAAEQEVLTSAQRLEQARLAGETDRKAFAEREAAWKSREKELSAVGEQAAARSSELAKQKASLDAKLTSLRNEFSAVEQRAVQALQGIERTRKRSERLRTEQERRLAQMRLECDQEAARRRESLERQLLETEMELSESRRSARELERQAHQLREDLDRTTAERDRARADLGELMGQHSESEGLVAQKERYIQHLKGEMYKLERLAEHYRVTADVHFNSVRYNLGDAIIRAAKPSRDTLALPGRLAQLLAQGVRQKSERGELRYLQRATETLEKVKPVREREEAEFAGPDLASPQPGGAGTSHGALSDDARHRPSGGEGRSKAAAGQSLLDATPDRVPRPLIRQALDVVNRRKPSRASEVRMLSVMDEFSTSAFEPECELVQPRPDNWESLARYEHPDLLFVESAWKGNDGAWQYRIARYAKPPGHELDAMVRWFREAGIPTVFWNKEDPVHYEQFLDTARKFDVVLTTDSDRVPHYREAVGHDRVAALPFAAQPRFNNPVALAEGRNDRVCFAGSYYANRFKERRQEMEWLLESAFPFKLDIYDRNHGNTGPGAADFRFPDRFQPYIRGRLPYAEMLKAYKRYRVFLNVNSVVDSPTMFSRRVFELLACGTPVVSTFSRGIEELLGEGLVWQVRNADEAAEAVEALLTDDAEWTRRSVQGIRTVFGGHTYRHRLLEALKASGFNLLDPETPMVLMLARVSGGAERRRVEESFLRQTHEKSRLLLVQSSKRIAQPTDERIQVVRAGEKAAEAIERAQEEFLPSLFGVFSPSCLYGRHYLEDLVHAVGYSAADLVGKSNGEGPYRFNQPLHAFGCLIDRRAAERLGITTAEVLEGGVPDAWIEAGARTFAADATNFIPDFKGWRRKDATDRALADCEI